MCIITYDGLYSAINFMINYFNKQLTINDIITKNNDLYSIPIIERYFVYFIFVVLYYYITKFLFKDIQLIIYFVLSLVTIPCIFNNFIKPYFSNYIEYITDTKNSCIKSVYKDLFCSLFFGVCDNHNILIIKDNFKGYIDDYITLNIINLYDIIIKSLIVYLMIYTKNNYIFYYGIVKHIYYYKYGKYFKEIENIYDAKQYIMTALVEKKIENIFNDDGIQSIIKLFMENSNDIFSLINYKIISFFSLWSIFSFLTTFNFLGIILIFILSIGVYLHKCKININFVWILISPCILFISHDNSFLVSFINQFGYILFSNSIVINNSKKILNRLKMFMKLSHNDNNTFLQYFLILLFFKYIIYIDQYQLVILFSLYIYFLQSSPIFLLTSLGIVQNIKNDDFKLFIFVYIMCLITNILSAEKYKQILYPDYSDYNILNTNPSILDTDEEYTKISINCNIIDNYFTESIETESIENERNENIKCIDIESESESDDDYIFVQI